MEVPANKVTEIKTESLSSYQILHRDGKLTFIYNLNKYSILLNTICFVFVFADSMVLYAPQLKPDMKNSKSIFEIVLHRPTTESVNLSYRFVHLTFLKC